MSVSLANTYKVGDLITVVQIPWRRAYVTKIVKVGRVYLHTCDPQQMPGKYNVHRVDPSDLDRLILAGDHRQIAQKLMQMDHEHKEALSDHSRARRDAIWNCTLAWDKAMIGAMILMVNDFVEYLKEQKHYFAAVQAAKLRGALENILEQEKTVGLEVSCEVVGNVVSLRIEEVP